MLVRRTLFATPFFLLTLVACPAEDDQLVVRTSLNQAAFVEGSTTYQFGYESIPNIPVAGGPQDIDFERWAMLHDGDFYRLYFFRRGSSDTLYQFAYNSATEQYEYGFNSIEILRITGAPGDADASSFAMLHDGIDYRLYMRSASNPDLIHQFAFNTATDNYEYGFNSIPSIPVSGFPATADATRWAMVHDGLDFRLYRYDSGGGGFFQAAYNVDTETYEYGYESIERLDLVGTPSDSDTSSFAMLHDGLNFRFYHQAP